MLFEAQMASPHHSTYRQHQFLQTMFVKMQHDDTRRTYVWCEADGVLFIRRTIPTNDLPWEPVMIPPVNSLITFELQARCRQNKGDLFMRNDPMFKRGARPAINDPIKNLAWLERTGHRIGLHINDAEVETDVRTIRKYNLSRRGFRTQFHLIVAHFHGVATIRDPALFEHGLVTGVGDSKAFGLGYLQFWQRKHTHGA